MHLPRAALARIPAQLLALLLIATGALSMAAAPASAAPTTLTLSAPTTAKAGTAVAFTATLTDSGTGTPVAGATVTLRRTAPTVAEAVATGATDASGVVVLSAKVPLGASSWQAQFAGDGVGHDASASSPPSEVTGRRLASTLQLTGPKRLVDERTGTLSLLWRASDGSPVSGSVTVQRRLKSGPWIVARRVRTTTDGRVTLPIRPRFDSRWRAVGAAGTWWLTDTSPVLVVDNVPPGRPASYPKRAPRPKATPAQIRAVGAGANAVLTRIPHATWRSMTGRSWHAGCPVGRSSLRLLRINYWGFDGYRYRGQMVLNAAVAQRAAGALRDMYAGQYPIRRMYRVDRFGWSKRLHGANDYKSMRADNTSAFNCRSVVNKPGVRSPHSSGRAVDINTWENPYRSATGLVPNAWWASRSHPRYAWRSAAHPVVRIWRSHGFRWTYANVDSQHLDGRRSPAAGSFVG